MLIGYARISTHDQTLALQLDALEKAGCDRIFTDKVSGAKEEREGLTEALSHLREGDTLVVWRLDRLGRSLRHLIDTVTSLNERGVGFKSLQENIDTTTGGGKLIFHIFGALEAPSIGWQLFALDSSQYDSKAFVSSLDTYDTRLLTEVLSPNLSHGTLNPIRRVAFGRPCLYSAAWRALIPSSWFRTTRLGPRSSKKSGLASRAPSAFGWRRSST
jgi:hypothetical protein